MHLLILALVLALFVHDSRAVAIEGYASIDWVSGIFILLPKCVLALGYATACKIAHKQLATHSGQHALRRLDRITLLYWVLIFLSYCIDLGLGVLTRLRSTIGDLVLVDEMILLAPPIAMVAWGWSVYYPIDRRIREVSLIRRLDAGLPVAPIWTRGQCVASQFRHQVALVLVPMLMMLAWSEVIVRFAPEYWALARCDPRPVLMLAGSISIFMFAPLVIRHLWDTAPLPPGSLRTRLEQMCDQHGVRVRELLLWRTFGGMINGAVMGLIAPVRYILLTDALLESMPQRHVEAVMAHELAHVRRRHMFWLVAVAGGALGLLTLSWMIVLTVLANAAGLEAGTFSTSQITGPIAGSAMIFESGDDIFSMLATVAALLSWAGVLGWASRRFERQADTFAVQHFARQELLEFASLEREDDKPAVEKEVASEPGESASLNVALTGGDALISTGSIETMAMALQQVADLNHISTTRRSWRHGPIAWRQAYLRSLKGLPIDQVPIDRQVTRIKIATTVAVLTLIGLYWLDPAWVTSLI